MNELTKRRPWVRERNGSLQLAFAPICLQVVKEKQTCKINSFHFRLLVEVNSHYFSNFFVKIFSCFSHKNMVTI